MTPFLSLYMIFFAAAKIRIQAALESARKSRTKIISIKKRLVFECADIFFMMPPWKRNSDGDKKFLCFLQNLLIQKNKNQGLLSEI